MKKKATSKTIYRWVIERGKVKRKQAIPFSSDDRRQDCFALVTPGRAKAEIVDKSEVFTSLVDARHALHGTTIRFVVVGRKSELQVVRVTIANSPSISHRRCIMDESESSLPASWLKKYTTKITGGGEPTRSGRRYVEQTWYYNQDGDHIYRTKKSADRARLRMLKNHLRGLWVVKKKNDAAILVAEKALK